MTKEEKELLLKDLCARLPYGVIVKVSKEDNGSIKSCDKSFDAKTYELLLLNGGYRERGIMYHYPQFSLKPYLRPMSSMTKDEEKELGNYLSTEIFLSIDGLPSVLMAQRHTSNFLYSRHLDILGLIEKGLALEAPEDMYNI